MIAGGKEDAERRLKRLEGSEQLIEVALCAVKKVAGNENRVGPELRGRRYHTPAETDTVNGSQMQIAHQNSSATAPGRGQVGNLHWNTADADHASIDQAVDSGERRNCVDGACQRRTESAGIRRQMRKLKRHKAGVAVIMDAAQFLVQHPEIRHGKIRILFTPDEEIGRGVDRLDLQKLGADFGYTLDAGEAGTYEDETFSADGVSIIFYGISAHPGYAKDKMVNALKVASAFVDSLPSDELSPETTEGRYGFVHPVRMEGIAEKVTLEFIIRDFMTLRLSGYEEFLKQKMEAALARFPGARAEFTVREQYRNMKEILDQFPQVSAFAIEAIEKAGLKLRRSSARGGTDGSRLSFMGLPCPNLFTGEMAFHGRHEFVSVQDMQKSVETVVYLAEIWELRTED